MPLLISRNDITKMRVDVIVNAANTDLLAGGGVCGAIFRAAGLLKLQEACNKLSPIHTGEAVITPGFDLPAKYVIHTAGPIYRLHNTEQATQLYNCYYNSMKLADDNQLTSIAFPLISSGIYGYPPHEALEIAQRAIRDYLNKTENDITAHLIIFDSAAFKASKEMFSDIESYIDEMYAEDNLIRRVKNTGIIPGFGAVCGITCDESSIYDMFSHMDEDFNTLLFKYIREKGMTNVDVYNNANMDRKLFSKIISNKDYKPSKQTIFSLAISLKLNIDETTSFLKSAGYAFSHSSKADLIVEYYISHPKKRYNIDDLNDLLFQYHQPQLGQKMREVA